MKPLEYSLDREVLIRIRATPVTRTVFALTLAAITV